MREGSGPATAAGSRAVGEPNRAATTGGSGRRLVTVTRTEPLDAGTSSMLEGLATLHAVVLAVGESQRVVWIHDELGLIVGDADSAIGTTVASLLDRLWPDDIETFGEQTRAFFDDLVGDAPPTRRRFDLRRADRPLSLDVSAFRARDAAGRELVVCVADPHRSLESLQRENEELEATLDHVAHDLRSPMASLLGFSRMLREDHAEVLDDSGLRFLSRIEQAGHNMNQLLSDMLRLSRGGRPAEHRAEVNPAPILEQLRAELKIQLDEKGIHLELPHDPPTLRCDRTRLYQLLSNLVGNAIRHMHDRPSPHIEVDIEEADGGWRIVVADNGPGIAAQDRERIFRAFQTAGPTRAGRQSSGLGLAIVKKIVESQSGRVWVESAPGSGSRFVVWLPKD
jgi:signal transduction histidine kinase